MTHLSVFNLYISAASIHLHFPQESYFIIFTFLTLLFDYTSRELFPLLPLHQVELVNHVTGESLATLKLGSKVGAVFNLKSVGDAACLLVGYEDGTVAKWDLRQLAAFDVGVEEKEAEAMEMLEHLTVDEGDATLPPIYETLDDVPIFSESPPPDDITAPPPLAPPILQTPTTSVKFYDEPVFGMDAYLSTGGAVIGCTGSAGDVIKTFSIPSTTQLCSEAGDGSPPRVNPTSTHSSPIRVDPTSTSTHNSPPMQMGRSVQIPNDGVASVAYRGDGKIVACGGWDGRIRYFSTKTMKALAVLKLHDKTVNCVTFDLYDNLTAGSADGLISIWDIYAK